MKRLSIGLFLMFCLASSVASAQSSPDFDRVVLGAIDTVPSRAALDAAYPDARDRLEAAARDKKRSMYARHRAITLLSLYPDTRTRAFLEEQLTDEDPEIRRMAVYTLGRGFGLTPDGALVSTIAHVIETDPGVVAQWAVRSLRWIAAEDAHALLRKVIAGDDARLARLAAAALRKSVWRSGER